MRMRWIAILAATFVSLGALAFAKDAQFTGCTSDKQSVQLSLDLVDDVSKDVEQHIQKVFADVAGRLTVDALVSRDGFTAFVAGLSEADKNAVASVEGPPSVVGSCK